MINKVRIKLFGRSKKELYKEMKFWIAEVVDDLDDILVDLADLKESVNEGNRLILDIKQQCNQIIAIMEKKKDEENKDV